MSKARFTFPKQDGKPGCWYEVFPQRDRQKRKTGQWYYRLRARNGQIKHTSEAYSHKGNAVAAAHNADQLSHSVKVNEDGSLFIKEMP